MPSINVVRDHLYGALGQQFTEEQFDDLCFEFGIELDKVSEEIREVDGKKQNVVLFKIDIGANRYDLLSIEGLTRALRIFMEKDQAPTYSLHPTAPQHTMVVKPSTADIRPYVVCAVLRGVQFSPRVYDSFIELQEKLHQNLCRGRTLVAIGTHDLDTVQGPFRYEALAPEDIKFVPLTETDREFSADKLMQHYREDPTVKHLKPFTDIIADSPVYPVIYDSNDRVLSLPPIINGRHSRIQLHTTNVFIECTATDQTKANIVLDTIVCTYSQYCTRPFTVEPVKVIYEESGREVVTPKLHYRKERAKVSEVNGLAGIKIAPEDMCKLCMRMQLGPARYIAEDEEIEVTVPPTRSDILHAVDVIEDVAIAHGYNNIVTTLPKTQTVGAALPINHFCDLLRDEIGRAGYVEMLTHGLCSREENFTSLRRPLGQAVALSNPQNVEYEVVRTTLLPGALKTLQFNRSMSFREGMKLFEVSDVVIPSDNEIGAQNVRRLVALYSGMTAGFEIIHGLVDRVLILSQIAPLRSYAITSMREDEYNHIARTAREGFSYFIRPADDPTYFSGRCADVVLMRGEKEQVVGTFGILHPDVLGAYDLSYPCSALEMDLEPLL